MGFADAYLHKQKYLKNISEAPSGLLRYIIIIPCYCEPDIFRTLESLLKQKTTRYSTEVLIHFNYSDADKRKNKSQNFEKYKEVSVWAAKHNKEQLKFIPLITKDIPTKYAGAGIARKIAMDIAVSRFNRNKTPDGFILSLDADTLVPENYLSGVEEAWSYNKHVNALIFNFEHDLSGKEFDYKVYKAITLYELHLRYFRRMLSDIGFPYPYFTIGSCFGVNAELYTKVGGMNRRKGGEDFYFLNKIFPFNNTVFLQDVILKPSSRPSWRVPFGTGPAIKKMIESERPQLLSYNPKSFYTLKHFIRQIPSLYKTDAKRINELLLSLDSGLRHFLKDNDFSTKLIEIQKNASNSSSFIKRFYSWFNAFMIIKYLNFSKNNYINAVSISDAVKEYLGNDSNLSEKELLIRLRSMDRDEDC